ncbi:MAG TPA: glycosyltransferase 87 family protein [Streptosporangiaceae bacterium]|nr:glycosyltransferase 87 family protein [Streptosporangiaceae bacterium]
MTLPLTRPPRGGGRDTGPRGVRWRAWLSRAARLARRRAAALCAAVEHEWAAALLVVCALFACAVAAISSDAPQRLWGDVAACSYGLAAVVALAGRRRGLPVALLISVAGAALIPLAWMASSRMGQPEVSVVIRSARLFLHQGTPYERAGAIATAHNPNVYDPYLPALAFFGLPRAVFGSGPLTDPRVWFGAAFVAAFGAALKVSGVPRPWLWTAVVTASPVIAYPLAVGGDDLPVLALICLGLALLRSRPGGPDGDGPAAGPSTGRIVLAGLALGLAAAMKATAWPTLAVALALIAARRGRRAAAALVLVTLCVPLAVDGPVLFAQPASVVSNTILFPLGLTKIKSPAASVLPGHLMAETWSWGHYAAIGLILLAGLAIAISLVVAPPRDERAAGWRLVIGLTLMFAFAPASRFGYIIYPLGLSAWLLLSMLSSRATATGSPAPAPADPRPAPT